MRKLYRQTSNTGLGQSQIPHHLAFASLSEKHCETCENKETQITDHASILYLSFSFLLLSFIVMASDNALTRKILNSPNHTEPCLVASAKEILIPSNWVFLTGKVHADYRKSLNVLFTRKALGIYLKVQETIYKSAFEKWLESTKNEAKPHMMECRNLNMDTSLRVFCGTYLPDEAAQEISDKYWDMTRALELVNFPLAFPGTKVYKAIQARKRVMHW